MAVPDPFKPMPAATGMVRAPQEFGFEADFADLAARFAAKSGGGLSPELSAELALEIVLNEIVEQACQITGATGAAIILHRDGELSCRASSGSAGPQLGSCLDPAGLAGECLRSRKTLWCDDTFTDPRAESEASRQWGVRSVVIMPLLRNDLLFGLFELRSTQPYAFGVRDERALELLADRTVTNLEHVSQSPDAPPEPDGPAADLQEEDLQRIGLQDVELKNGALESLGLSTAAASQPDWAHAAASTSPIRDLPPEFGPPQLDTAKNEVSDAQRNVAKGFAPGDAEAPAAFANLEPEEIAPEKIEILLANAGAITPQSSHASPDLARKQAPRLLPPAAEPAAPKPVDYVSWALGFGVVSLAILLGLVLGQHFLLSHLYAPIRATSAAPNSTTAPQPAAGSRQAASVIPVPDQPKSSPKISRRERTSTSHESASRSDEAVPPGGLVVSENGKEVFRLPPANVSGNPPAHQLMQSASEVDPDSSSRRVVDLPEASAQREVVYRSEPQYPEAARAKNIQGQVVLELHIGTNGSVQDVEVVNGPPILAQASTDAVKQWKFKPRALNGIPVEMQTRVTFDFRLPQ